MTGFSQTWFTDEINHFSWNKSLSKGDCSTISPTRNKRAIFHMKTQLKKNFIFKASCLAEVHNFRSLMKKKKKIYCDCIAYNERNLCIYDEQNLDPSRQAAMKCVEFPLHLLFCSTTFGARIFTFITHCHFLPASYTLLVACIPSRQF